MASHSFSLLSLPINPGNLLFPNVHNVVLYGHTTPDIFLTLQVCYPTKPLSWQLSHAQL